MADSGSTPESPGPADRAADGADRSLWRRIAGDGSHLGFWTLPVFVATALGGAVVAGALANVYYGQQVDQLEEETAAARSAAERAAEDIEAAREEALAAIDEQLEGVRDALEVARPLEDPATAGVVTLTVELTPAPDPSPTPDPSPDAAGQPGGDGQEQQGAPLASTGDGATEEPTAPSAPAEPPPPVADAPTRTASGFAVAVDGGSAFVATTFSAVADPRGPDGVAVAVTVRSATASARGVVHAWDRARGVAIVRVPTGDLPILPWRPSAQPLQQGDVVVLAAVTPGLVGVQLPGRVGAVTGETLVTDLPTDPVFDGAPLVDAAGRVVALQDSTATPFGVGSRGAIAASQLCVELISGCEQLEAEDAAPQDAASED